MRPFVPKGWTKKLLIIGEAAGEHEDEQSHRPFTGPAGQLLLQLLQEAGFQPNDVAFANSVRCRPRRNATPTLQQVRACRPFVLRVLMVLQPRLVCGVGAIALKSLTNRGNLNVTKARGRAQEIPGAAGRVAFVTYHPAAVLRGAVNLKPLILEDLRNLLLPETPWPKEELPTSKTIGIDTEWGADGVLLTIGLADGESAIAYEIGDPECTNQVTSLLTKATALVGHSVANDLAQLAAKNYPLTSKWIAGKRVFDSLLLARMTNEERLSYELESVLLSILRTPPWKSHTAALLQSSGDMTLVSPVLRKERCRLDAWAAWKIAQQTYPGLPPCLVDFTHRTAHTLARLTLVGSVVSLPTLGTLGGVYQARLLRATDLLSKAAHTAGMEEFSPTNDGHLRELLYKRLKLPILHRTPTRRPAVDKATLTQLDHDVARLLVEYSQADKLYTVNVEGLKKFLHPCGTVEGEEVAWLAFNFNPLGARTGRRAAHDPNSQNWAEEVRKIVRSRYPGGSILDADYRKLEPRLIGWVAQDDKLLHAFTKGRGYVDIARELLGWDVTEGTPEYKAVKSIVLGVHYNMQTPKMAKDLWLRGHRFSADFDTHEKEVGRLRRLYLTRYPGLRAYMRAREREFFSTGQVVSLTRRVRHLGPARMSADTPGYGHLVNQAINFPIQSLASDITASALVDIEEALIRQEGMNYSQYLQLLMEMQRKLLTNPPGHDIILPIEMSFMFNEVHDSILADVPKSRVAHDRSLIIETMRAVPSLKRLCPAFNCPLDVDIKCGPTWGFKKG